ncbi:MAG: ABC transporter ATP-binding protein [Alphaproteobacteria bacterium]
MEQTPELALSGVTRQFDESFSLQDVGFSVADGESIVLIGPSASGKTVTLKTIAGLFRPDSGSIKIRGQEMTGLSGRDRDDVARLSMLFQRSALFDSLTVWENITFRLRQNSRMPKEAAIDLARAKLAAVGLAEDTALLYPVELSGGMQKRVGIARALADEPEILLLDEPTAGLDPIMTNVINDLILENVRDLGATVVSITSNLDGARHIADRIIMMNEGRTVWEGVPDDLDHSGNAYVDQFVHKTSDGPIGVGLA